MVDFIRLGRFIAKKLKPIILDYNRVLWVLALVISHAELKQAQSSKGTKTQDATSYLNLISLTTLSISVVRLNL
jgi:hypothetical protein